MPTTTRNIAAVWKDGVRFDHPARERAVIEMRARAAEKAPEPEGLGDGLISDFEDGLATRFGEGWSVTSDARMGGGSVAEISVVDEGAGGSARALEVSGEVKAGYLFPWAGAAFAPGRSATEPADLSAMKGIRFWARGDGGDYALAVRAQSLGYLPARHPFTADAAWTQHEVTFEQLGIDGSDTLGIMFLCSERRPFRFQIGDVRLI